MAASLYDEPLCTILDHAASSYLTRLGSRLPSSHFGATFANNCIKDTPSNIIIFSDGVPLGFSAFSAANYLSSDSTTRTRAQTSYSWGASVALTLSLVSCQKTGCAKESVWQVLPLLQLIFCVWRCLSQLHALQLTVFCASDEVVVATIADVFSGVWSNACLLIGFWLVVSEKTNKWLSQHKK